MSSCSLGGQTCPLLPLRPTPSPLPAAQSEEWLEKHSELLMSIIEAQVGSCGCTHTLPGLHALTWGLARPAAPGLGRLDVCALPLAKWLVPTAH